MQTAPPHTETTVHGGAVVSRTERHAGMRGAVARKTGQLAAQHLADALGRIFLDLPLEFGILIGLLAQQPVVILYILS